MKYTVFDIEADGLLEEATKIHCLSYAIYDSKILIEKGSLTEKEEIIDFLSKQELLVAHNCIRYDIPLIKKLFNYEVTAKVIDTLGLSWYLYPKHKKHGLEWWGDYLGVKKPVIKDWKNLKIQDYIYRCETDVEINVKLFIYLFDYLIKIYGDLNSVLRLSGYISFKLDCLREQEEAGITLDVENSKKHLNKLESMFNEKTELLSKVMPPELGAIIKDKPKVMFKKDGNLSHYGKLWVKETSKRGLDFNKVDCIREEPNPGSNKQLKEWLFSLGWKPKTFKISKATGEKIPQVSLPFGGGICSSVKELYEIEPNLKELEGYFMIKHRIGIFKSYFKNLRNGKVYATAHGFARSLRLRHAEPIVNLPKPGVFYGNEIRGVLTVPNENYIMCGSDVSALEDSTKQHYIYFYDPEYVKEMRVPGFDPHVDIGILAGLISKEDAEWFKWAKKQENLNEEDKIRFSEIKKARGVSKTANFAATYGAGPPKMAETAKIPLKDAIKLHRIYWKRNHAIRKIEKDSRVKTVEHDNRKQKWIYNPVSEFWLPLKTDKDRFSVLNQSTGSFIFDLWLKGVRIEFKSYNIPIILQTHDEMAFVCKKELKDFAEKTVRKSMKEVNKKLQLNIEITVSVDWGNNYKEVH